MENSKSENFSSDGLDFSFERDILEPAKRGGASEYSLLGDILNAAKRENILPEEATINDLRGQITDVIRQFSYKGHTKIKLSNGEINLGYIPQPPGLTQTTLTESTENSSEPDLEQEFENGISHYRKGELGNAGSCFSKALSYFEKMGLEEEKLRCREFLVRTEEIPRLFPFDREQLIRKMTEEIDNFKPEEFDKWETKGYLDSTVIDGKTFYYEYTIKNLVFNNTGEVNPRFHGWTSEDNAFDAAIRRQSNEVVQEIQTYKKEIQNLVNPEEIIVKVKSRLKYPIEDFSGKVMKIWSPFPLAKNSQQDVKLIRTSHPYNYLSPPESDLGVIYFEIENDRSNPEFQLEYTFSYLSYDMYFNLDPAVIQPYDNKDPSLELYLKSEKHITITDDLKNLAYSIVKDEKNPLSQAMLIYVWMTDNLIYNFVPHEIIEDESEYVLRTRKGDCGSQAIFYAALCRALGIPARVSGGWQLGHGFRLNHLWTEIYLQPYGWVPVDAAEALHQIGGGDFDIKDWPKLLKLFFGVFDRHHVYIHNNINLPLTPSKTGERSFEYAFHLAEKEYEGVNLPFRNSEFEVEIIKGF